MTLVEYQLRMEAYQLKQVAQREDVALQAWFNQSVQATVGKKNQKPKFKKFEDFYDREKYMADVRSSFENDYEASHLSKNQLAEKRGSIFMKRMHEFEKLKSEGKIIPLDERRKE